MALVVKNLPASAGDIRDVGSIPGWGRSPREEHGNIYKYTASGNLLYDSGNSMASQVAPVVKNPPDKAGDIRAVGSIPGLGRSPGGGHVNPLQYSCLENPHGQRSLVGYSPWGRKELDMTEQLSTHTDETMDNNTDSYLCFKFTFEFH